MKNNIITSQPITLSQIPLLIDFDHVYLRNAMEKTGVPDQQLPPLLTMNELEVGLNKNDYLQWLFVNNTLAGYVWIEKKMDCIYIAGVALKPEFHGQGLIQMILHVTEQIANENNLSICRLAAIPLNGRAINAYLKWGYKITACVEAFFGDQYPDSFRFILEKNLLDNKMQEYSEQCEIYCYENEKLKHATDNGYVGISLIASEKFDNAKNKILFKK